MAVLKEEERDLFTEKIGSRVSQSQLTPPPFSPQLIVNAIVARDDVVDSRNLASAVSAVAGPISLSSFFGLLFAFVNEVGGLTSSFPFHHSIGLHCLASHPSTPL